MMSRAEEYQIAFTGLSAGTHDFDFFVGDGFFERMEDPDITGGEVKVKVIMTREERMMDLHFTLEGNVRVACDRCNAMLDLPVRGNERLIVKLGDRYFEESEDVQVIPETSHQVDLGPFIYEYIHLLLPARRVHGESDGKPDRCDPEVLRKLEELSGSHAPDPRWEALRKLKDPGSEEEKG